MSIFKKIGQWLKRTFKTIKTDGAKIAVAITQGIQEALKSGLLGDVAKIIEAIFPNVQNLPEEIVEKLKVIIPKVLITELAIQGLPDDPTEEDVLSFEKRIMNAFGVHDQKSKLYTTLAAQVYGILHKYSEGVEPTFAQLVKDVEEAYQDYKRDVEEITGETID